MRSPSSDPTPDIDAHGPNAWLVEELRRRYLDDPASVGNAWRRYFAERDELPRVTAAAVPEAAPPVLTTPSPGPPAAPPSSAAAPPPPPDEAELVPLRGSSALLARHMDESRELPTATSVRTVPAKLLEVNRRIVNNQLARLVEGGKVSFTHLIGWAVVRALRERPAMNVAYLEHDGSPHLVRHRHVNLGLAMDVPRKDGTRSLLVPVVRHAEEMSFGEFHTAYEDLVARVRSGRITPDDFLGATATLTNPGTVGTALSVPRLMRGQGLIVGVGAIAFPPEYEGSDPATLAASGIGRVLTLTSTYDHRVIQGAESGLFLERLHRLLLGEDGFYEEIFAAMEIPYVPARWAVDTNPPPGSRGWAEKQARLFQLINMYRVRGHLIADLDPLRQSPPRIHRELDPLTYGLTIWDLEREFATGGLAGRARATLEEILGILRDAYCRTTGIEFTHIQEADQKAWIHEHVEGVPSDVTDDDRRRILRRLNEAQAFERFLHTKYVGATRFSLEGAETLIPLLDAVLDEAADAGMDHAALGMAHRGRLNVLANIAGKRLTQIFQEFEGAPADDEGSSGDVKYHLGATGVHRSPSGAALEVSVANNPSHLEAVDPVLEGIAKAKQDARGPGAVDLVLPVLIHGDAAFAGQGVAAETFELSQLEGYATGGTVHVVVNNQVGFTTGSVHARSSQYATDVAKMVQAPIFHVNGDDPEAAVRAVRLAFRFRQAFHKDVVIDLVCYRRLGHNEGDEPTYTQPRMYARIEEHQPVRDRYLERLLRTGVLSEEEAEEVATRFRAMLDAAFAATRADRPPPAPPPPEERPPAPETAIAPQLVATVASALRRVPEGFTIHPKLARILERRHERFAAGVVDWAMAEALAFGSLALQGKRVRLAGEDSARGTFSHRHAILVDVETEERYVPLRNIAPEQQPVDIIDSPLSEYAALGFEYGYSVEAPDALVMWEAQYGDFANGAQVIIDQFIVPGFDKWQQESSVTLLLPHGYEGQGPEHSSARIERFLQDAAEDNLRVTVPSTAAQYFHLLRRQALWGWRRPLVVATPKSLLRAEATFGSVRDLTDGRFHQVLPDRPPTKPVRRVLLCSGKVFYDLERHRTEHDIADIAILRLEQLYPFPTAELKAALAPYGDADVVWIQEEPGNMGAWRFVSRALFTEVGRITRGIYRPESASPATGSARIHARQQQEIVARAFS